MPPPLDPATAVHDGGDRKISSSESITDGGVDDVTSHETTVPAAVDIPESFWLSKDAEYDWFDRNAFLDRKDSGKSNAHHNSNFSNSTPNSQRFTMNLKPKATIIGLPKARNSNYAFDSTRRASANVTLFPKRNSSVGRSAEPSSPKVSCMGRVRSKRGRRKPDRPVKKKDEPVVKGQRTGFISRLTLLFGKGQRRERKGNGVVVAKLELEEKVDGPVCVWNGSVRVTDGEPPGLGAMKRFTSGRRSSGEEIDVASRDSLEGKVHR